MVTSFLLPTRCKLFGALLSIPALIAGLMIIVEQLDGDFLPVSIPPFLQHFIWYDQPLNNDAQPTNLYFGDELICLSLLTGLLILAFCRERDEDERIRLLRLAAFQWAMVVNAILLACFIVFTHGMPFLTVMVFNMFTPLLLFVGRFYYTLYFKAI
jgi:hypothetical protein